MRSSNREADAPPADALGADFRMLAAGQALSWFGDAFQPIALSVAILTTGGTAAELGLVMASGISTRLACSLVGGVWADRLAPQKLMIGADVVRGVAAAAMATAFLSGRPALWALCVLAGLSGGSAAFFSPAMMSLRAVIVGHSRRQAANATLSMLHTSAAIVGPVSGGLLVAAFGPSAGFGVNAATFAVSALTVRLIRMQPARVPHTGFLLELRGGWQAVRERDWLLWSLVAAGVYHVANGVVLVLIQVVAVRELGGASAVGFASAAMGAGGLAGSLIALRTRPSRPLFAGFLALGLMPLWVVSYVWPGTLPAVLIGTVIGYCGLMFFSVCWDTALQDNVPHALLARVSSWDTLTSFIGMPLGNALAGPLSERFGIRPVLLVSAAVILVAGVAPLAAAGTRRLARHA